MGLGTCFFRCDLLTLEVLNSKKGEKTQGKVTTESNFSGFPLDQALRKKLLE